jgi:hypothetical protein
MMGVPQADNMGNAPAPQVVVEQPSPGKGLRLPSPRNPVVRYDARKSEHRILGGSA